MLKPRDKQSGPSEIRALPLSECLAKTVRWGLDSRPGASVETHCRVVGLIARELLSRLPERLRASLFPLGSELVAAAHDVGKVSPAFQEKIHRDIGRALGLTTPARDKEIGYHFAVSQAATSQCPGYISEIVGRHHGYTPHNTYKPDAEVYGGSAWQKQRQELLHRLRQSLQVDWPIVPTSLHSDILAGLTSVADWIGSGSLFDDAEAWMHGEPDLVQKRIADAVTQAGFVAPRVRHGLTFERVFESMGGFAPRDVQRRFAEQANDWGVYVLEAPMGIGKTEAALYAAYKALESGRATGVYFALPTQLTSDKLYDRMNSFLESILDDDDPNRRSLLLHGLAWLRDTELGEEGAPGRSWFNSSKRGLLAPFAVGTIDQALMAVMNVKYGFVRTFGLAGKVVILDEVHSYDSYTGTILNELVSSLRALQCTVIILSATLTDNQRRSILGLPRGKEPAETTSPYPLITSYPHSGGMQEQGVERLEDAEVNVRIVKSDDYAVEEALLRAERGEQVLWIENTVDEAQQQYRGLAARAAELQLECGLLHSRFLKADRQANEGKWVGLFGKDGYSLRQAKGRILVGTQVLEQSLDIDADFLVTRLCPTDMLFQRLGRLWRHRDNDFIRPQAARREAWVLAPCLHEATANLGALGNSAAVYSPYVLCRTLDVWQDIQVVRLPGGIRPLLEATYRDRDEFGNMARSKHLVEQKREKLSRLALYGVARGGKTLPESQATTRHSEIESVEVLLMKKQVSLENGVMVRFLDNSELLLPQSPSSAERRRLAAVLLKNTVTVPVNHAPAALKKPIKWLSDYVYLGDDEEHPFRAAMVLESDEVRGTDGSIANEDFELSYDSCLGYGVKKKGGI